MMLRSHKLANRLKTLKNWAFSLGELEVILLFTLLLQPAHQSTQ